MLLVILQTLKAKWTLFAGSFIALSLMITLLVATGNVIEGSSRSTPPQTQGRYDAATVIVRAPQTITEIHHQNTTLSYPLTKPVVGVKRLPASVAANFSALSDVKEVVIDHSFSAQLVVDRSQVIATKGNAQVGHGWSSRLTSAWDIIEGTGPRNKNDVVIDKNLAHESSLKLGAKVDVITPAGTKEMKVAGIVATQDGNGMPGEDTVFFNDEVAAELSLDPANADVLAIITVQNISQESLQQIRALAEQLGLRADTGAEKGGNIAQKLYYDALEGIKILMGTAIVIAGLVSVFIVASAANLAIIQRRRELALLRLSGATPGQVVRMILVEAVVIGLMAAITGVVLGNIAGSGLANLLIHFGVAPVGFNAHPSVFIAKVAVVMGIGASLTGVFFTARGASKIRAIEAMQDAVMQQRQIKPGRFVIGALCIAAIIYIVAILPSQQGEGGFMISTMLTPLAMISFACLMPLFIKPMVWLITWPFVSARSVIAMLIRANTTANSQRAAALIIPVMLTITLVVSMLGTMQSLAAVNIAHIQSGIAANAVVTSQGAGMPLTASQEFNKLGVTSMPVIHTKFYGSGNLDSGATDVGVVDPARLRTIASLRPTSGSMEHFTSTSAVISQELTSSDSMKWQVGQNVLVYLPDGSQKSITIAAVVPDMLGLPSMLVSPDFAMPHIQNPVAQEFYLLYDQNIGDSQLAHINNVAQRNGGILTDKGAWITEQGISSDKNGTLLLVMLTGLTILFALVSLASTTRMGLHDRISDIKILRMSGATNRQITRMILGEMTVLTAIGSMLGLLIGFLAIISFQLSAVNAGADIYIILPYGTIACIAGLCLLVSWLATLPLSKRLS